MIQDLAYDYPGDPSLADLIAAEAARETLEVHAHKVQSLALEYGSIVPMRYMNTDGVFKVLPVASPLFARIEEAANSAKPVGVRSINRMRMSSCGEWLALPQSDQQSAGRRGSVGSRLE